MATSHDTILLSLILDHCAKNGWHQAAEQLRNEAHSKGSASVNLPPSLTESHYSFLTEWFGIFWDFYKRKTNSSYSELRRPQQQHNPASNNLNININLPNNLNNLNHNSHLQHQQFLHHQQQQQQLHHHQNSFHSPSNPQQSPHQDIAMSEAFGQIIAGQSQTPQSIVAAAAAAAHANIRNQIRPRGGPTPPAPPPSAVQQAQQNPNAPSYINPLDIAKQFPNAANAAAAVTGNINLRRSTAESLRKNGVTADPAANIALQQQLANQKKRPSAGSANVSLDSAVMQATMRGSQLPNGTKKRARVSNPYPVRHEDIMRNMSPQHQMAFQARFQHHNSQAQAELHHQHQQQLQAMAQIEGFQNQQMGSNPMQTPNSRRNDLHMMLQQQQQAQRQQQLHRHSGGHQKMAGNNTNQNSAARKDVSAGLNASSPIELSLLGDNPNVQQQSNEPYFFMGNPSSPSVVGLNSAQNRAQGNQQQRAQYNARMSKKAGSNNPQNSAAVSRAAAAAVAAASSDRNSTGPNANAFAAANAGDNNINIPVSQQQRTPSFTTGATANGLHDSDSKGMMPPPYANSSQTNAGRVVRNKGTIAAGGNGGGAGTAVAEANGDTKPTTGGGTPSQRSVASGVSNGAEQSVGNNNNTTTTTSRKSKTNRAKQTSRTRRRKNTTSPSTTRKGNGADSTSNMTKKSPKKSGANGETKSSKKQKGAAAAAEKKNGNGNGTTGNGANNVGQKGVATPTQTHGIPVINNNIPVAVAAKKDVPITTDELFTMDGLSSLFNPPPTHPAGGNNNQTGNGGAPPPSYAPLAEDMESQLGMVDMLSGLPDDFHEM